MAFSCHLDSRFAFWSEYQCDLTLTLSSRSYCPTHMLPIKSQIYDNSNEGSFVKIACIVKIICLIFLPPTPCLTLFGWFGIFNSTPKECQISQLATICQLVNMHFHTPQIYSFMKNHEDMCAIASLGRPLKWGPCCSTNRSIMSMCGWTLHMIYYRILKGLKWNMFSLVFCISTCEKKVPSY